MTHTGAVPHRRRTDRWWVKIALALIITGGSVTSGYYTAMAAVGDRERSLLERIARLEAQRESDYKGIIGRLDDLKEQQATGRQESRADINGIRDEMFRIIRNK